MPFGAASRVLILRSFAKSSGLTCPAARHFAHGAVFSVRFARCGRLRGVKGKRRKVRLFKAENQIRKTCGVAPSSDISAFLGVGPSRGGLYGLLNIEEVGGGRGRPEKNTSIPIPANISNTAVMSNLSGIPDIRLNAIIISGESSVIAVT